MFDLNVVLCDRFPALDPFRVRAQRYHDVLLIYRRLNEKSSKTTVKKRDGVTVKNGVIRRPAMNDDWY
jgi:hypothetical protein